MNSHHSQHLKSMYNAALATTRKTAIDAAEALPDDQARGADHEVKKSWSLNTSKHMLELVAQLDRYIDTAYTDTHNQESKKRRSSSKDYDEARAENWEKVKSILLSGKNFLSNHTADLTAGGNMPLTFSTTYNHGTHNVLTVAHRIHHKQRRNQRQALMQKSLRTTQV
jgi:hypothetical protein